MYTFAALMRHIFIALLAVAVLNMVFFVPQYERLSCSKVLTVNAFVETEEHVESVLYHICAELFDMYFPPVSTNAHFLEKDFITKRSIRGIICFVKPQIVEEVDYAAEAESYADFLYVPVAASMLDGFKYIGRFTPF
jgi:hypothetical protein